MADRYLYGSVTSPSAGENPRVLLTEDDRAQIGGLVTANAAGLDLSASAGDVTITAASSKDLKLGARGTTINLNESGDTSLDPGFTASSLVGAANELKGSFSPEVTGVILATASGQVMDSYSHGSDGWCKWTYHIQYGANLRAGTILAVVDVSSGTTATYSYVTTDIGNTAEITFAVDYSGGLLRLKASNSGGANDWNFNALRVTTDAGGGALVNARNDVLQRIDTGAWETAQTGVEYYSPDQQGGFFGTVRRQFWSISGVSGDPTLIASGVQYLVAAGGHAYNSSTGNSILVASYKGSSSVVTPRLNADEMILERFGDFDDTGDSAEVWVDYVLT